ncbi:catalase [Streptomyces sp. NRRL B-1677]|uniref:catalase n=1 Tax=Streptomyces sp. NRRL B-1677 TaxID=2682966 RepID=UPI001892909D|nr:catalase [Streptomyces sp. NRRL B-1677]MBF6048036.1 catalase [Streptomyces sp. NRRL B-1677]
MTESRPVTTTDSGIPVPSDEFSQSVGADGPLLLQDHYLIQKLAHFDRERVPERVVHAKGGGAYGTLEITEDVSQFTKADVFRRGKRTELFLRFSTVAGELGFADTARDPRGFAVKLYSEEGNYDIVGNNTPIFFIRDPQKFPDFIHSQKRRADNHLHDNNMQWDFWTLSPESAHQVTLLMSDRGTPYSWRHMNGYGSHTFLWYNAAREKFWVKYHFKTDQGIRNFTGTEAAAAGAEDPDFHIRDLHEAIGKGDHPTWTLQVQVMPFEDAADYRFNPFDLTKVWPHEDYPPIDIGTLTLNRNPENYFAEVEQAAFEPSNLVPGVGASPDKMLQGRLFSYPDTHRYRIGANYLQLPVNRPKNAVHSYNRDGSMRYDNPGDPVYAPNSFAGPVADPLLLAGEHYDVTGEIVRSAHRLHAEDDDFGQARALWEKVMTDTDRDHLVANIVAHASAPEVRTETKERVVDYWRSVHKDLGDRVSRGLGVTGQ